MCRYRRNPAPAQQAVLVQHCAHARYVWNLAVEQQSWWRLGRNPVPGYGAQAAQLTEARSEFAWLAESSQMVQQQALRDFAQAMTDCFSGTHSKPTWRKVGRHEGFPIVAVKPGHVRRLSRHVGQVWVPKAGWVRFRCTACGYTSNADVNAAKNIAAGHAVTARGRPPLGERMNREPQPLPPSA